MHMLLVYFIGKINFTYLIDFFAILSRKSPKAVE